MCPLTSHTEETILEIDLNALAHNYAFLKSHLNPYTKMMAVVKAFGYGSDAAEVAKELEKLGVNYFAVAYVKEGVSLRENGVKSPILVLHPLPHHFEELIDHCLEPAIYSTRILDGFLKIASEKKQQNYPIHIKINTGLNRLGFTAAEMALVAETCTASNTLKVKSVFSHLAASEDLSEREFTLQQIKNFKKIASDFIEKLGYPVIRHQSNTSTIINYPEAQFEMVRTGIGLYGYGNNAKVDQQLRPVATLKTVISQIHSLKPGDTVGYNRAHEVTKPTQTATLPLGHADGISRQYGNGNGWVLIHGKKAPIIGNVCMDMLMVDITNIPCEEGDEVIVIGKDHNAEDWAKKVGTISYELLTALSQRIKRVTCRK